MVHVRGWKVVGLALVWGEKAQGGGHAHHMSEAGAGSAIMAQHTLMNWLESCGGCCTARKLCSNLSHIS